MRVVEVCEVRGRVPAVGARGIAYAAGTVGRLVTGRIAQALGSAPAAGGRGCHGGAEGGVDEVRDTAAGALVLVTGIGRRTGEGQGRGGQQGHGAHGHAHSLSLTRGPGRLGGWHVLSVRGPRADWRRGVAGPLGGAGACDSQSLRRTHWPNVLVKVFFLLPPGKRDIENIDK